MDISHIKAGRKRRHFSFVIFLEIPEPFSLKPSQNSSWSRFYALGFIAKTCSTAWSSAAVKWGSQYLLAKFLLDYWPQWHCRAGTSPWVGHSEKKDSLFSFEFVSLIYLFFFFLILRAQETRNCSSGCPLHRDTWTFCFAAFLTYLWSTVILMSNKLITNTCNAPHRPPKQCQPQFLKFWYSCWWPSQ